MTTERDNALTQYLGNPCNATRNALIAHHHNLIHFVIRRFLRIPRELHEDAFQEGVFGLCRGIERFDPTKGPFPTFAMQWIRASIQKWMESEIRQSRCAPIKREGRYRNVENRAVDGGTMRAFGRISGEAGDDQRHFALFDTIADSSPGPQERAVSTIARERVRAVLARFDVNEREAAILREHVCEDVPLQVLAERFGVTKQRMGQIKTDLLRRMEVSFEPEEGRR